MGQLARGIGLADDLSVLVIEDDADDIGLVQRAFRKSGHQVLVAVARSSAEALDRLHGRGGALGVLPDLILLDLGLPGVDGRRLLSILKSEEDLRRIPVIVLSGSDASDDVEDAYFSGASSFVRKPESCEELEAMIRSLVGFWSRTARLPQRRPAHRADSRVSDRAGARWA